MTADKMVHISSEVLRQQVRVYRTTQSFFLKDNLDLGVPKTILFLLYTYGSEARTVFLQYNNIMFSFHNKALQINIKNSYLRPFLTERGWKLVGLSYNKTSTEAQLWINGSIVNSKRLERGFLPKLNSQGSQSLTLGREGLQEK